MHRTPGEFDARRQTMRLNAMQMETYSARHDGRLGLATARNYAAIARNYAVYTEKAERTNDDDPKPTASL